MAFQVSLESKGSLSDGENASIATPQISSKRLLCGPCGTNTRPSPGSIVGSASLHPSSPISYGPYPSPFCYGVRQSADDITSRQCCQDKLDSSSSSLTTPVRLSNWATCSESRRSKVACRYLRHSFRASQHVKISSYTLACSRYLYPLSPERIGRNPSCARRWTLTTTVRWIGRNFRPS